MTQDNELVSRLATVLREEIVRQYRDDDRGKCPGGAAFYEENVAPYLLAKAAIEATGLETLVAEKRSRDVLEKAARRALNYIENTEGELGITLECGDALRTALADFQPSNGDER